MSVHDKLSVASGLQLDAIACLMPSDTHRMAGETDGDFRRRLLSVFRGDKVNTEEFVRNLVAEANQKLWAAMHYVLEGESPNMCSLRITSTDLRRVIDGVEHLLEHLRD